MDSTNRQLFVVSDTSVILSFVCSKNQDLLISFTNGAPLYVPEAVASEMRRKLTEDRFEAGRTTWFSLIGSKYIKVLEDTIDVFHVVRRFAGVGFRSEAGLAKDLGEFMCLAHCLVEQDKGKKVAMIVDDGQGQEMARKRQVRSFSSEDVLLRALQMKKLRTKSEVQKIWEQLSEFDTHVHFSNTKLSNPKIYRDL
ncbi:hypothetical protein [Corynebacterium evansiae]|uniref:Uncharacterized protein n=1 Tax=Corynebacterium evansiae TaxID=2913499 RepID=A0A9X3LMM4_9CORY|nr:hypothetical protein [Corynebacterium evansiae]MCZ9290341.1 hypothetical protein [Corynebacterium evansiae]